MEYTVMAIEQIEAMWAVDNKIDEVDLSAASRHAYSLHSKYTKILNAASRELRKREAERDRMTLIMTDYYLGNCDQQTLRELNLKPHPRLVLKGDLPLYLNADDRLVNLNLKISDLQITIKYLESIIRTIHNSNFHIKNILDHTKFINGGY